MTFLLIVTISSMLVAAIMSVIAWRIAAEERKRSDARVAALAADIHAPAAAVPRVAAQAGGARVKTFPPPRAWGDDDLPLRPAPPVSSGPVLFSAEPSRSSSRNVMAIAAVLIVGGAIAFAIVSSRKPDTTETTAPTAALTSSATAPASAAAPASATAPTSATARASAPAVTVPLELVALGHDRDGDRLTVRGVVRNPPSGQRQERLAVVVFAFQPDGGFLTSARAIIEPVALAPGGESTFVVTVPGAAGVGRYRVSFRSDDRVVPHVDKRELPRVS
jgi:hypothetical protein